MCAIALLYVIVRAVLCSVIDETINIYKLKLFIYKLTDSVHWAITVATTVPPFGDHGNPSATLAMVLPPPCLLCATCCATAADLVVWGRYKGYAAAVTQKQNFLRLGDHWASWPFFWSLKGGTKVAALCKGGFTGELWGVFRELFNHKWPRYIESAL